MAKTETPLLDDLEKGKWPSFVRDMKQAAQKKVMAKDLLRQLEKGAHDPLVDPLRPVEQGKTQTSGLKMANSVGA